MRAALHVQQTVLVSERTSRSVAVFQPENSLIIINNSRVNGLKNKDILIRKENKVTFVIRSTMTVVN